MSLLFSTQSVVIDTVGDLTTTFTPGPHCSDKFATLGVDAVLAETCDLDGTTMAHFPVYNKSCYPGGAGYESLTSKYSESTIILLILRYRKHRIGHKNEPVPQGPELGSNEVAEKDGTTAVYNTHPQTSELSAVPGTTAKVPELGTTAPQTTFEMQGTPYQVSELDTSVANQRAELEAVAATYHGNDSAQHAQPEQPLTQAGEQNEPWRRVELDSTQHTTLRSAATPSPDPSTAAKQPVESPTDLKKQLAQLRAQQAALEERLAQQEQNNV